jgi:hypothetical protein
MRSPRSGGENLPERCGPQAALIEIGTDPGGSAQGLHDSERCVQQESYQSHMFCKVKIQLQTTQASLNHREDRVRGSRLIMTEAQRCKPPASDYRNSIFLNILPLRSDSKKGHMSRRTVKLRQARQANLNLHGLISKQKFNQNKNEQSDGRNNPSGFFPKTNLPKGSLLYFSSHCWLILSSEKCINGAHITNMINRSFQDKVVKDILFPIVGFFHLFSLFGFKRLIIFLHLVCRILCID